MVYSELRGQAPTTSDSGVGVHSADGFIVEQYSRLHMTVHYVGEVSGKQRCHFLAPDKVFANVHPSKKQVACLDVTSGGLAVSSDTDGHLLLWTTDNGEVRRHLEGHFGDVYTCRFFPSGVVVLSGGADTQLKIWSAETGQCAATLIGHTAGVSDIAIVERGRNVVSSSRDGTACLWDCGKSACLTKYAADSVINACCLHVPPPSVIDLLQPDHAPGDREILTEGKLLLLSCENGSLQGFGLHSRKKIFETLVDSPVNCCCPLSDFLIACGTQDSTIHCVDLRAPSCPLSSIKETRSAVLSVMSLGEDFFFTTGDGSCVCIKSSVLTLTDALSATESCTELTGSDCDPVYRGVSDGRSLFTCCRDSVIRRYALSSLH